MKSLNPWSVIVADPYGEILYPRARYGHPFYKEAPSWINYSGDEIRHLFDGVFVGAEPGAAMPTNAAQPPAAPRKGLLADVAPVIAPATGPITVKKEFDDRQVLHVEICVDGKCYRTSMDLAPAIAMVMQKLAQWHQGMHAPEPPPSTIVSTTQRAIDAAADEMVGVMVGHHVAVMTSGWLSDIGGAIGGTLRTLGPVISTVATGVATAYGGPAAGAAAGQLVPMWTNLQANLLDPKGDPAKKAAAQQKIQQINQQAQSDPKLAQALAVAHQAVKNTAVAYHVKDTADKAASGDKTAQVELSNVVNAAEQGDPAAKSTWEVIAATLYDKLSKSETGAKLWQQITGRGPGTVSGWGGVVVGGFWDDVKDAVLTVTLTKQTNQFIHDNHLEGVVGLAGQAVATYYGGPAAGAAAKALGPTIMSLGVEDKKKAAAAQSDVHGVKTVARRHGPQMAQAVDVAHGAIDQTATAYQVAQMVKDANAGVPEAQRSLANLQAAAAGGDQKAARALQAANAIAQAQSASPGGRSVVGWSDIAGVVIGCGCTHVGAVPYYGSIVAGPYYGSIAAADSN
jgi:hypothetical protein